MFLFVLTVACLYLTSFAQAEEPAWWEQCEALPVDQVEECFYQHNGEAPPSERPPTRPTAPISARIARKYPGAHTVFIHCPGNNRLGEDGIACEFRFLRNGSVVKGNAAVEAESESWSHTAWWLTGFHAQAPASLRWNRCKLKRHRWESAFPVRLSAHGTDCAEARVIAYRIANFDVSNSTLRLPRHFNEGEFQANTLGFVVSRYKCRGRVQVRQGNPNPYGHETASCRTRFDDRITFVFDQSS